jgi:hypothetical protein
MKEGFLINKGEYAAVPYVNGYIILHNGRQLEKVCRTEGSAKKYIEAHRASFESGTVFV